MEATVTYKGEHITYELFHQLEDAIAEIDGVDYDDPDRMVLVTRTAQRLDSKA